jgi:hypothetical protein
VSVHGKLQHHVGHKAFLPKVSTGEMLHHRHAQGLDHVRGGQEIEEEENRAEQSQKAGWETQGL